MNRFKQRSALAMLFALTLLIGGYGTVRAQQAEAPQTESLPDSTACPMMGEGEMMDMEDMDMQAMMERCPMMKVMMGSDSTMQHEGMMRSMMQDGASGASASAVMNDGTQTVVVTVGPSGFAPKEIRLQAGIPARLDFMRTTDRTCATEIQIPAFGVEKTPLPLNEEVAVAFTPEEAGTFAFTCGMGMMGGTIVVTS